MWSNSINLDFYETLLKQETENNKELLKEEINIQKLCRTCLKELEVSNSNNLLGYFKIGVMQCKSLKFMDIFKEITGLQVHESDLLPHKICNDCIKSISAAYFFRIRSHRAERILNKLIENNYRNLEIFNESLEANKGIIETDDTDTESNSKYSNSANKSIYNGDDHDMCQDTEMNGNNNSEVISDEVLDSNDNNQSIDLVLQLEQDSTQEEICEVYNNIEILESEFNNDDLNTENIEIIDSNEIRTFENENIELKDKKSHSSSIKLIPSSCSECGQIFTLTKNIEEHYQNFHPTLKPFECEICQTRFTKIQAYKRHSKIHQNDKNKLCTYCSKSFSRADDLKRHIRCHTNERPYQCELCSKSYKQSSGLKEHMITHSNDKKFHCNICGKSLQSRNGLYVHIKNHQGIRNHKCEMCNKCYVTSGELQSHIRHVHNKNKPYLCSFENCKRSFCSKSSLDIHSRSHTGERPYRCFCGKYLASSSSLNEHKKIHTNNRNISCSICSKSFLNKRTLKRHMNTHQNNKSMKSDCTAN